MTLVTFGCSWTFGVGANYTPDMNEDDYQHVAWSEDAESKSFRRLIAKKHNLKNINFSKGGCSNDYNLRRAREFFLYNNNLDDIIVLWGITSTARAEYFDVERNKYKNTKLDYRKQGLDRHDISLSINNFFLETYSHDAEVKRLGEELKRWEIFFETENIPVVFYDTFNTHNYPIELNNLIKGDLLTHLLQIENIELPEQKIYHMSSWRNDDPRITAGIKHKLINPISFHPTAKGHQIIAKMLTPYINERLKQI